MVETEKYDKLKNIHLGGSISEFIIIYLLYFYIYYINYLSNLLCVRDKKEECGLSSRLVALVTIGCVTSRQ